MTPVPTTDASPSRGSARSGWLRWVWRQLTQHAHRAVPPAAAGHRRGARARSCRSAASTPPAPPTYIASTRTARAVARPPRLLRGLRLAVVRGDLPAAVRLARRLRRCPAPRMHWHAMRAQPPRAPRAGSSGCAEHAELERRRRRPRRRVAAARAALRGKRFRVHAHDDEDRSLSAESGYLRETGNLVFHARPDRASSSASRSGTCSAGAATSSCPAGKTFANTLVRATTRFSPGPVGRHRGRSSRSRHRRPARRHLRGAGHGRGQFGAPRDFTAHVTTTDAPGRHAERSRRSRSTTRCEIGGAVGLPARQRLRPGRHRARRRRATSLYRDATPFLPQDNNYTSVGAIKVPVRPSPSSSASPGSSCRPPSTTYANGPQLDLPRRRRTPSWRCRSVRGRPLPRRPARSRSTPSTPTR